jgi:hypothetical protein
VICRQISLGVVFLALLASGPALACDIESPPLMTEEERAAKSAKRDREFVESARSARAIIEIKARNTSGEYQSGALVDVLRVYKGKVRKGSILKLDTLTSAACGAGGIKRGERGIIILSKSEPKLFMGFLWSGNVELLQKEGILPPSESK